MKEIKIANKLGWEYFVHVTDIETIENIKKEGSSIRKLPFGDERFKALNSFRKHYGFDIDCIIGLGDTKISHSMIKDIIPFDYKKGYKCYVQDNPSPYVKIHEDVLSSWNCIIEKLNRPTHVILFKVRLKSE